MALIVSERAPRVASVPLLHVTDVFPGPAPSPALAAACARGRAVHSLCEAYDLGREIEAPPEYAGYLTAWKLCLQHTRAEIVVVERPVGGEEMGYVGRLDRVVRVRGRAEVWDLKSGGPWPTHGPQTAAYDHAYRAGRGSAMMRACVHLKNDGTYEIRYHRSVHDLPTFMAYLRVARWEIEHGLRPVPQREE